MSPALIPVGRHVFAVARRAVVAVASPVPPASLTGAAQSPSYATAASKSSRVAKDASAVEKTTKKAVSTSTKKKKAEEKAAPPKETKPKKAPKHKKGAAAGIGAEANAAKKAADTADSKKAGPSPGTPPKSAAAASPTSLPSKPPYTPPRKLGLGATSAKDAAGPVPKPPPGKEPKTAKPSSAAHPTSPAALAKTDGPSKPTASVAAQNSIKANRTTKPSTLATPKYPLPARRPPQHSTSGVEPPTDPNSKAYKKKYKEKQWFWTKIMVMGPVAIVLTWLLADRLLNKGGLPIHERVAEALNLDIGTGKASRAVRGLIAPEINGAEQEKKSEDGEVQKKVPADKNNGEEIFGKDATGNNRKQAEKAG